MSGFFGIFRPQGGPVDLEAFEQMKTAMHREGFDGMETHVEDKIAMGHLMLRVSSESKYDKQPLKSSCGNYLLVGHFRLDYRDELSDKLGLTQAELELTPDSQLVMLSYQKWKQKCVNHLEGDWAFVVVDFLIDQVHFFRDKFGCSALFYIKFNDSIYFTSDTKLFSKLRFLGLKVDNDQLLKLSLRYVGLDEEMTLFKNVHYVPHSKSVSFNRKLDLSSEQSLQPLISHIKFHRTSDYIAELQSVFSGAVKSRVSQKKSMIGIFLSSGMDSTTVASFTAFELSKSRNRLFSFTACPAYLEYFDVKKHNYLTDKFDVDAFISMYDNILGHFPDFKSREFSDIFKSEVFHDCYYPIINPNVYWIDGILSDAKSKGISIMLTGQAGNFSISYNGKFVFLKTLINLEIKTFYYSLLLYTKTQKISMLRGIKHLLFDDLLENLNLFFFSHQKFKKANFIGSAFSDSILYFFNITNLLKKRPYVFGSTIFWDPLKFRIASLTRFNEFSSTYWYEKGLSSAIIITDPTADERVLDFLKSVPQDLFFRKGVRKFILKEVLASKAPSSIVDNQFNRSQSIDAHIKLENDFNLHKVLDELLELGNRYKILDLKKVMRHRDAIKSEDKHWRKQIATLNFLYSLSIVNFLVRQNNLKKRA
jgi:asparagine synthase (glutamine-hydrolysing)